MPTAKDVPAVIDLLNDRSIVDLCQVKTTTRGITIPPRKNLIIKCYANTGHVDCRQAVMFESDPEGCWPEVLEVSESILSIPRGSSCHINIPVANTSDYEIYVHPKTIIGSLQLISSITPLDGKLVSSPTVESKEEQAGFESEVKESMEGDSFLVESKIESTRTEKWLPPVDLSHLEESQRKQVEELLREECETFSKDKDDIGNVPSVQMEINLSDTRPVQKRYNAIHRPLYPEVKAHIQDLLNKNFVSKSTSPYSSPIVAVRKKNNELRLCCDFRELNQRTIPDKHPLPKVQDALDALHGKKYFSLLDQGSAYHQAYIHPNSRHMTAFCTPWGLFQWNFHHYV